MLLNNLMGLILIFMHNGIPLLYPNKGMKFDKSRNIYYTGLQQIDVYLASDVDKDSIMKEPLYKFYGCVIDKFHIIQTTNLATDVVVGIGKTRSGDPMYINFLIPAGQFSILLNRGIKLKPFVPISTGFLTQENLGNIKELVISLYNNAKKHMKVVAMTEQVRSYMFYFYNSDGELYHKTIETTVLDDVKVYPNHEVRYFMRFRD